MQTEEPSGPTAPFIVEPGVVLGDVLGEGGTAVVRAGLQSSLDRRVAVKEMRPDLERDDLGHILVREARITGMLEHPNIIPIHDITVDSGGRPRIVMRKVSGSSWTALLEDPDAARATAGETDLLEWHLRVLLQVCNAVHYAHSVGIVHRDLKPDNVMVGAYGEVYVVDWGLAVTTRGDAHPGIPRADRQPYMAGTPSFMAPEMLGGGAPITERTDVFLLGATLFAVLAGRPPYPGRSLDPALLERIAAVDFTLPDDVPAQLAAICRKATARDPAERYGTVEALRVALERYLRQRGADALVEEAGAQLARLRARLEARPITDAVRLEAYDVFGRCRFGFEQALRIDPERKDAIAGRRDGALALARYEVERGDPDAASVLLSALDSVPPDLAGRLDALWESRKTEAARLAALDRDRDSRIGQRTRLLVVVGLSAAWTVLPILGPCVESALSSGPSYALLIGVGTFFTVVSAVAMLVFRGSLLATSFNRWLLGGIVLVLAAQVVMDIGCWLAGLDPGPAHALHLFLWFVVAAFAGIVIERRMAIPAVAYLIGWLVAARFPWLVYPLITVTNAVLLVVALWMWGRPPAEWRIAKHVAGHFR